MTDRINENLPIRTKGGNDYHISPHIPQVLLLHPVLGYLVKLRESGINLDEWIEKMGQEGVEIEDGIRVTGEEARYYYNYLLFLDKHRYFEEPKKMEMTGNRYDAQTIEFHLANTQQIVFETTNGCNLRCRYCGYGELYTEYEKRGNKTLDFDIAGKFFDYMIELIESPLNRKTHKKIACSFYGGEPTLNMPFIKEMVRYAKSKPLTNREFFFTMTTNGIELDKHIDFFVENEFRLLISFDGNERNSDYRVFPDGSASFDILYNNVKKLKEKYPGYFEEFVDFNAVLHDKNSNKEINSFIMEHFGKSPIIGEVNPLGIKPEKREEFDRIFKKMHSGLTDQDFIRDVKDKPGILGPMRSGNNRLNMIVHFPLQRDVFKFGSELLARYGIKKIYRFVIETGEQLQTAEELISSFQIGDFELTPFYNGSNSDFFKKNIYLDRNSIAESVPTMNQIFSRTVLNTSDFKTLTILPGKDVYANLNHPKIGRWGGTDGHILHLVYEEMHYGKSWTRVRKHVAPCKSCVFNALCPPISNYEYAIGRYDLCHAR